MQCSGLSLRGLSQAPRFRWVFLYCFPLGMFTGLSLPISFYCSSRSSWGFPLLSVHVRGWGCPFTTCYGPAVAVCELALVALQLLFKQTPWLSSLWGFPFRVQDSLFICYRLSCISLSLPLNPCRQCTPVLLPACQVGGICNLMMTMYLDPPPTLY